jgi:aarF domain-containing kinase
MYRLFRPGVAALTLAGSSFFLYDDLESITRPLIFWKRMFPIYLEYRITQFKSASDLEWKRLHEKYAPQVLDIILDLRGIYIKMGQVLSQRPDVMPKEYRDAFTVLLDGIPGLSGQEARDLVEKNLGVPIDSVFSHFDDQPMGAASIAQAHRATLLDGREVVVKVQHPDSHALFGIDINTMNRFVRLAQPEQELLLDEFEKQMLKEFDFEREAWALETIYQNCHKEFPNVLIPRPINTLTRKNVLVMDYIPGMKLIDAVAQQVNRIADGMGLSIQEFQRLYQKPSWTFRFRLFGYFLTTEIHRYASMGYNVSFGNFWPRVPEPAAFLRISHIYQSILQIHGKQFLVDGIFNADPHPGNILVTPEGKLGLIDYGQVKTITRKDRRNIARMILLLSQGPSKRSEVVLLARELGFETTYNQEETIYKVCMLFFDRDDLEVTDGLLKLTRFGIASIH